MHGRAPDDRRAQQNLAIFAEWSRQARGTAARRIHFRFRSSPREITGDERVRGVVVAREKAGAIEEVELGADMVVSAVGYRGTDLCT